MYTCMLCMCVFLGVRHKRYVSQVAESLSVLTSAGAAHMVSTNKMTNILAGKKFKTWLSDAICHSSDSFFMSECCGFSPHGTVLSPTASASPLSEDGDTFGGSSAVSQKMCCSRLAAPGILAPCPVVKGWTLGDGIPLQGWTRDLRRGLFLGATYSTVCIHIWHSLSSQCDNYSAFILWRSQYQ